MPVAIKGTGGGSVTLSAAAAATDTTLTIPNVTGTVLQSGTAVTVAQGGTGLTSVGTSGNVLTSNGTAWVSSAPASTASLTLLATLTTTSGTTQSATGLPTTYTNLLILYENVGNSTGNNALLLAASTNNGSTYGATNSPSVGSGIPVFGSSIIYRANSSVLNRPATVGAGLAGTTSLINTLSAAPINALQFSWITGYTFNSGTIYIYGWN